MIVLHHASSKGPGASGPFVLLAVALTAAAAVAASGAAGADAPGTLTVALKRTVANIEFSREGLFLNPAVPGSLRLPPVLGRAWHGALLRRVPEEVPRLARDHFVPFMVDYVDGKPVRAWCDEDLDGDLTDQPPVTLNAYPAIAGARSFLASFRWRTRAGPRAFEADRTFRVVLEPVAAGADGAANDAQPQCRLQSVFAMTGTADLEGRAYPVVLFDGDGDGVYAKSLFDGVYVDVDRNAHLLVDPMGPEFASFEAPLDLAGRAWIVSAVDPEGLEVTLRARGPAVNRPPKPLIGSPAPDFTIRATDGGTIRLSALRGRPVLVYFWTSTCPTCAWQAGPITALYERYHPAGLEMIGISYDTDRPAFDAFRAGHRETWPTSFSGHQVWDDPVGRLYRERGTGIVHVVDRDGTLIDSTSNLADLETEVARLLASPAGPSTASR
ncbi:MAG TPA: redoxin domain-containing protein [Candidatus Polarisedimenticolia bacterium]|nr:redoxin domain-containing protein [Candidatus Polarisedimenticolia bacterium]